MVEITAKEKALQLYNDAYKMWANELSYDKNKQTAKSIATYVCDEILKAVEGKYDEYWQEVKTEIEKL